jgi:hypothetical protein
VTRKITAEARRGGGGAAEEFAVVDTGIT